MHRSRRLVLVRHAKAETFAASDAERALTDRGRGDAAELGRWLADVGIVPDVAHVSDAVRTRQTWAEVAAAAGWALTPQVDAHLYGCEEDGVLEIVRAADEAHTTLVVVGHNPTMGSLVQWLDDGEGDQTGAALTGFPTSAAAVLEFDGEWSDVASAAARLADFHVGRS